MVSTKMLFSTSTMMLVALLLMAATAVLASPITTLYPSPALTSTSKQICPTTVVTFPTPVNGPTTTVYTTTSTITREYDCHGCGALVVVQLGHIFPEVPISYNATTTDSEPSTHVQAVCSSTPGDVQTETSTVSTTETAEYVTVTVEFPTTTPIVKRSKDFGGGHKLPRCIDWQTGKPIPGCSTVREVDEQQPACWSPITGLFDPVLPECKITSRSQADDDSTGLLNVTRVKIEKECIISCNASINHDDPPFTIQKLEACIVPCINEKTHGQSTTCPVTEHAASEEVEIQERQIPQCVECPYDGGACVEVDCPPSPECVECPADGSPCTEVDCATQGEKRDVVSACYDKCVSQFTSPSYSELHYCTIECAALGIGPVCVGEECLGIVKGQASPRDLPPKEQAEGCFFEGTELLCPTQE